MKSIFLAICVTIPAIMLASNDTIPPLSWPREIESDDVNITLYQPQLESFEGNVLEGRMAVSLKQPEKDMLFAAIWFKAKLHTDMETRTATLDEVTIPRVNFPGIEDTTKISQFKELLISEAKAWDIEMSIDRLLASLNEVEDLKGHEVSLDNSPPDVFFRTDPAVLVSIDGEPITKEYNGLEYVVNTQFFMVRESKGKTWYMKGGKFWYASPELSSEWKETDKVPSEIEDFAKKNGQEQQLDSASQAMDAAPEVIVSTKPAELITTGGEPDYASIEGTQLLYVKNSESDIIMDINTQQHYVLLAGRWYHSKTLADGDWQFQEPNDLPKDFANIPEDSDMANVRANIPGTPEAQDALLEQSIPQTAQVDRKTTVEVKYDGEPKFEKVTGTGVSYAVNTDKQVLLINGKYYCVDDGIWFVSKAATGPWAVSDERPDEVDDLPADSPVYNVKYVYVYDSTPDVVYVGYTPGYTYSYVYGGTVVYGTGFYYPYWYGAYYYPRPVTYGFGVHYSPYTGWGFSVSIGVGWVGWGYHPYGCWGPRGYNYGYRHGYAHGYHRGYNRGYRAGYAAGHYNANRNVYNNRSKGVSSRNLDKGRVAGKARPSTGQAGNKASQLRNSSKPNNMYTDKRGNVYQRDSKGNYQSRSNHGNKSYGGGSLQNKGQQPNNRQNAQKGQQPSYAKPSQSSRQQMDRSYQNRNRGSSNFNNHQRSGGSRSFGGSRGGGSRGGGIRRR